MTRHHDRRGLPLGIGAFTLWAMMPLFFPLLQPAGAVETAAHRVVWTLVFCLILLAALRQLGALRAASFGPHAPWASSRRRRS